MSKAYWVVLTILILCTSPAGVWAEDTPAETTPTEAPQAKPVKNIFCLDDLATRDTLTNNWFGLGEKLGEHGIVIRLGLTQIYQINLHGGMSTHRRAGRYTGSYDLVMEADLEKLMKWKGASLYIAAEGSWSDGLDASSIGSLFGINDDAAGDRSIDVTEFHVTQELFDGKLEVRIGKVSPSGGFECRGCAVAFDANSFANDSTSQFLNSALANNPQIPFPDNGLGVIVYALPMDHWYIAAGITDAQADVRTTGFSSAFGDEDYFFSIYETGLVFRPESPTGTGELPGAYRIGMWYSGAPMEKLDGSKSKRDVVGLYVSCDQLIYRESKKDEQGLGVFFRFGIGDSDVSEIKTFYSAGAQYQGLLPCRDNDVLGLGFAHGVISKQAGTSASNETVIETYYNFEVTPWCHITPSLQYVFNPGGSNDVHDAVVAGIRCQLEF